MEGGTTLSALQHKMTAITLYIYIYITIIIIYILYTQLVCCCAVSETMGWRYELGRLLDLVIMNYCSL